MQLVINLRRAVRPFVNTRQPLIQLGFQLRKVVRPFVNSCQPLIQLVINLRKVFFHVFDAIGAFLQGIAHVVVFCGERRHHKIIFGIFGIDIFDRVQFNGDNAVVTFCGVHLGKNIQPPVIHAHNSVGVRYKFRQLLRNLCPECMVMPFKHPFFARRKIESVESNNNLQIFRTLYVVENNVGDIFHNRNEITLRRI